MRDAGHAIERWLREQPAWPILAVLAVWLLAALWLGNDFGLSFDERRDTANGAAALRAYAGSPDYFSLPALSEHGPLYFEAMSLTGPLIGRLLPGWTAADGRHLTHFLCFLIAVYLFYRLTLRLAGRTPAWMASVLFATQPLLVGHGFINPKDTPFMTLFLASFVTGLALVDQLAAFWGRDDRATRPSPAATSGASTIPRWKATQLAKRWLFLLIITLAALVVVDGVWFGGARQAGEAMVRSAYAGSAIAPVQQLFDAAAPDAYKTPLGHYLQQFDAFYAYELRFPLMAAAILGALISSGLAFPRFGEWWGLRGWVLRSPALWVSAAVLGATVCVRQLGVFAGGLVALAMFRQLRTRAIFPLMVYGAVAAIVLYATWPYLWPAPIARLLDSLVVAVRFPGHDVFFDGRWLSSAHLPWFYFPKLVALQLTIPALLLAVLGVGAAVLRARSGKGGGFLAFLLALWVGVPAVALVVLGMSVYGNIRHLLFTMPAILAFSAVAFEGLRRLIRHRWMAWAVFAVAILPGVWGLISLHPYEYTYMNEFVGGVSGAYGRYELDRQCLSLRAGIDAANRRAEPGSLVAVPRQIADVRGFARPDLSLAAGQSVNRAAYVLTCSWPIEIDLGPRGFHQVDTIRRGRAVFATLWQR